MTDGSRHHRRSIRLRDYDYSQPGAYFITVCAQDRESLFGDVLDGVMALSEAGQIVERAWLQTPDLRPNVELDAFVLMPNHFHAIAVIAVDRQAMARGGSIAGRIAIRP